MQRSKPSQQPLSPLMGEVSSPGCLGAPCPLTGLAPTTCDSVTAVARAGCCMLAGRGCDCLAGCPMSLYWYRAPSQQEVVINSFIQQSFNFCLIFFFLSSKSNLIWRIKYKDTCLLFLTPTCQYVLKLKNNRLMTCRGDFVMCKGIAIAVLNKICIISFTI